MVTIEQVLVAGASGRTGRHALGQMAGTPVTVRALTRSAEKTAQLRRWGADEVVVGDLMDRADARAAVADVDAVLSAVGSTPLQRLRDTEFVDGRGTINLVDAAVDAGVEAFVMVSALGVGGDRNSWMARSFRLSIRPLLDAKTRAERAIRDADLRHTIFRPGVLSPAWLSGAVRVSDAGAGLWGVVARADLARLMVAAPFTPAAADRTFEVASNPLVRGAAQEVDWREPPRSQ